MLGMILVLIAIGSFFAALAVAYWFALADRPERLNAQLPVWFWASTALMALSSAAFQWARRHLRFARLASYRRWLVITIQLGFGFLATQLIGCQDLMAQGVYVVGNPRGSVYFLFSGVHAAHLIGGLGGLYWLLRRAGQLRDGEEQPLRRHRAAARNTAAYWHFMGLIWAGLFALLIIWR